jgi:hypothetical protein
MTFLRRKIFILKIGLGITRIEDFMLSQKCKYTLVEKCSTKSKKEKTENFHVETGQFVEVVNAAQNCQEIREQFIKKSL